MNFDDIEVEIVVLSGKWKFSLSSFIKLRQGATEGHYKVN
jgi:flagellar motor switch/type III secretory pathway protein FliN